MNTAELMAALRARYAESQWAFIEQVRNQTGYRGQIRTADALAMGLWPSKGLDLNGFELKVSRSDWLRELQDVSKARAFQQYCDYWWLVSPAEVAKLEEIPASWGWMVPTKQGNLRVRKAADANPRPLPIDRKLLAGICRAINRPTPAEEEIQWEINRQVNKRLEPETATAVRRVKSQLAYAESQLAELRQAITQFEAASGIRIRSYDGQRLGEAVAAIERLRQSGVAEPLERAKASAESLAQLLEAAGKPLRDFQELLDNQFEGGNQAT